MQWEYVEKGSHSKTETLILRKFYQHGWPWLLDTCILESS
jgi:hypothetical protein